jgi:signal peptide peptidase SppA
MSNHMRAAMLQACFGNSACLQLDWPGLTQWLDMAFNVAAIHPNTERAIARKTGSVAVVPVSGPIFAKPNFWEAYGLGISCETLVRQMRQAVSDPDVKAVVMDINSPGGTSYGLPEAAAEILKLRGDKPIIAQADYFMASAAYWLGSCADEIVGSSSAFVGSVGVYALHADYSKMLDIEGIKPTFVFAGKYKTEANPYEPLSDSAKAAMQHEVDATYQQFLAHIAAARGISVADVEANYGQGRVLNTADALAAGVIDKVRTLEETLNAYGVVPGASNQQARASSYAKLSREIDLLSYR